MSPKARQAKGKARLGAYEKLLAEANAADGRADKLEIVIPSGERLGDVVIEAEHLAKGYGDRLLIEDLSFSLPPAGIVGVIGANGAGKTTLFRMLTGARGARRAARCGSARPCSSPTSTRAATPRPRHDRLRGDHRRPRRPVGRQPRDATAGPTWRRSTSRAPTSRRRSACSRAASATGCTWPRC